MQVILQENIPSLGKAGDIISAKEGYARNYLIPKGLAVVADTKNVKQLEHQKKVVAAKESKRKKEAEELSEKLGQLSITISREAGEGEKIFGAVTSKDVSDSLRKEGYAIDRHSIKLDEPLKQLGIFDVPVKLHSEVTATVKVWVVKK